MAPVYHERCLLCRVKTWRLLEPGETSFPGATNNHDDSICPARKEAEDKSDSYYQAFFAERKEWYRRHTAWGDCRGQDRRPSWEGRGNPPPIRVAWENGLPGSNLVAAPLSVWAIRQLRKSIQRCGETNCPNCQLKKDELGEKLWAWIYILTSFIAVTVVMFICLWLVLK